MHINYSWIDAIIKLIDALVPQKPAYVPASTRRK